MTHRVMRAATVIVGSYSGFSVSRIIGRRQPIPSNMKKAKPMVPQKDSSFTGS